MKKKKTALMLILFVTLIGIISSSGMFKTDVSEALPTNNYEAPNSLRNLNLKTSEYDPPWWNLTYHYRKPIMLTEPGYLDRVNEPVEVEVNFDSGKAYKNSLRLLYYDEKKNKWIGPLPVQLSDTTFDPNNEDYIKSTKITFLANASKGKTETYYLYYTDYSVEEKTYRTDIYVNESMISNSYFTWWINPPKIFKYPNSTDVNWNSVSDGWVGYSFSTRYYRYGACLNDTDKVKLLKNEIIETGPIYAKILYRYEVDVYYGRLNIYDVMLTVYAKKTIIKVEMDLISSSYGSRGLWGTVMDVEGTYGDDYYVFYTSSITPKILDLDTYSFSDSSLIHIRDRWTWVALYGNDYGVGIIAHKDYYDYLYVSREVGGSSSAVYNHELIFARLDNFPGIYYYYFFKAPLIEPWSPVNETATTIAYPLSEYCSVGNREEAYYSLKIRVKDKVGRIVENADIIVYNKSDPYTVFNESFTSSNGEALIRFYCNTSISVGIKVNYTTDAGVYVENNTVSVDLDINDVRVDISLAIILNLVDLYVTVRSLDNKMIVGANVRIFNSNYVSSPLLSVTNSSGVAYFQRVLGCVSWLVNASYTAASGFDVKNDTCLASTNKDMNVFVVILPLSDLQVTVVDMLGRIVNEYTVFLYYEDTLWDQQTTDTGTVIFRELPAKNFTLKFKYLSKPEYGDNLSPTTINVWHPSNRSIVVTLPLAYMHIIVTDVNNESIPSADVIIKSSDYTYYGVSNESGIVNFERTLFNTTWNIQVSFVSFEGKGSLISVSLKNVWLNTSDMYVFVELPVTDMVIHVLTAQQYNMTEYWKYGVGGAVVYANITGEMDLVTNATDAAGYTVAKFVPVGRYNVTIYFLEQSWSEVFDVYNNSALHFVLPFKYAQIATRLSVTSPSSPYVNVIWTENITVELTFYVVETNTFIAYGWINWSLVDMQGNTVLSGFGSYDEGHEVYIVSFNSSEVPAGRYTLKIYGGKASYPPPSTEVVVVVEISKVPTELILEKERIRVPVGSDYVSIRVFYKDVFHNASIVNASVILTLENQSYQMMLDEENSGWYVYDLPVSNLSMGVYEVKVYAEKTNYEPVERSISLQITEKVIKIGTVSVPRTIFFASIIGIGVPIAGIAGFYVYRYLRVPKVLRTLNKIISKVEKGERIPLEAVADVRSRRDIVSEKVNKLWRGLGIKFGGAREEGKESG